MKGEETIESLRSCRDHWQVAFQHERENVIRLRRVVAFEHAAKRELGQCMCEDCKLVRAHATGESSPPTNIPFPDPPTQDSSMLD